MSASEIIVRAMRDLQPDPQQPARLATVSTVTQYGVTVVFDGESVVSARTYTRLCGALSPGDRVVMLRIGATWAALTSVVSSTQTPWVTYVPVVTATSGTFTDLTGTTGRYRVSDRVCTFSVSVPIVNAGTAAGGINIALPFAAASGIMQIVTGREEQSTGKQLQGKILSAGSIVIVLAYDNTGIIASGRTVIVSGSYVI